MDYRVTFNLTNIHFFMERCSCENGKQNWQNLRNEFQFSYAYRTVNNIGSRAKSMNPKEVHVNFASDPIVVYTLTNLRKIKFIVYIYIRFIKKLDIKSYLSG